LQTVTFKSGQSGLGLGLDCTDAGKDIDILYLDLQKAVDKAPHKHLIHKLEAYGVAGDVLGWIIIFRWSWTKSLC